MGNGQLNGRTLLEFSKQAHSADVKRFRATLSKWIIRGVVFAGPAWSLGVLFAVIGVGIWVYEYDYEEARREDKLMECIKASSGKSVGLCAAKWGKPDGG